MALDRRRLPKVRRLGLLCPRCESNIVSPLSEVYCCYCALGAPGDSKVRQQAWMEQSLQDRPKRPRRNVEYTSWSKSAWWEGL